jgi:hypothetical protein
MDLPLLGSPLCKAKAGWERKAKRRARAMRRVLRGTQQEEPCTS